MSKTLERGDPAPLSAAPMGVKKIFLHDYP
jgi:hypothetical protein